MTGTAPLEVLYDPHSHCLAGNKSPFIAFFLPRTDIYRRLYFHQRELAAIDTR